ncbi:MAG: metallophosphoesterase, partial [Dysgonamonadaceae bacterium]|nr:metallophosphoesterase [Dysgonamonadaceae bacterium]
MKTNSTTQKLIYVVFLLTTSLLISCGTSRKVAELPKAKTLEILAVNDIHAALDNFPRLAFMADSLRNIYPDLLLVSGGDNQTGNPVNDQYPEKGMPIIELMNALNFDMSAVGNHEFDSRLAGFEHITHKANFDFLCANIILPKEADFRIKPYKIIETPDGIKIAIVSVLHINNTGIPDTHPDNVKGVTFKDPIEIANDYLFLKDSCDVFVMLNHFGFENDVMLAKQLPTNTVDVIIGGHSHTKIDKERIYNG